MNSGEAVGIGYNLAKCFQSLVRHSFNLLDATASLLKYIRVVFSFYLFFKLFIFYFDIII